jgi:hypothetical protein
LSLKVAWFRFIPAAKVLRQVVSDSIWAIAMAEFKKRNTKRGKSFFMLK